MATSARLQSAPLSYTHGGHSAISQQHERSAVITAQRERERSLGFVTGYFRPNNFASIQHLVPFPNNSRTTPIIHPLRSPRVSSSISLSSVYPLASRSDRSIRISSGNKLGVSQDRREHARRRSV